jgi:hypothetical protein
MDSSAANTVIAICAAIIALLALGVSVWEGMESRKYNRLITRPHLRIDRVTIAGLPTGITVTNDGVGPAIIRKFRVICDKKEIIVHNDEPPSAIAAKRLGLNGPFNTCTLKCGDSFAVGETKNLLVITHAPVDVDRIKDLRQNLRRIDFDINYESVYGEQFFT